ncbi:MAG: hypothetical protein H6509_08400 [Bryobacterales bacterium]|nr:hypothetical protein [Bryobacterales bacterium]
MTVRIDLGDENERLFREKAAAAGLSVEDYAKGLMLRDLASRDQTGMQAALEDLLGPIAALPPEAFDGLPTDGASQHDHYIYGTPKRDDL